MGLDPELAALMQESITVELSGERNAYGEFIYTDPITVNAYIARETIQTINREGTEVTSTVQMYLARPELEVTPDTRVTLPNGDQPKVISVHSARDELNEPYYLELRA
jgi:hypothetical protein